MVLFKKFFFFFVPALFFTEYFLALARASWLNKEENAI